MFYPDRKHINHETMRQFVRDNFSQFKWKDIVLENSCGPIPGKPSPKRMSPKRMSPKRMSPKRMSPSPKTPSGTPPN